MSNIELSGIDVIRARLDQAEAVLVAMADNYDAKADQHTCSPRILNNLVWAALELTQQGQAAFEQATAKGGE